MKCLTTSKKLRNPHRDRYKDSDPEESGWNKDIVAGIEGLKAVYSQVKRRGLVPTDKEEIKQIYTYGFLAAFIYTGDPYAYCKDPAETYLKLNPKAEKVSQKYELASVENTKSILKQYKLFPTINGNQTKNIHIEGSKGGMFKKGKDAKDLEGTFKGIFGGRKIELDKQATNRQAFLEQHWKNTVEGGEVPKSFDDADIIPESFDIPRYTLAYAKEMKEICIMVRGTSSMGDALTDMVCNAVSSVCGDGITHAQMQWAALTIAMDVYKDIADYVKNGKCTKITCVGHSLGAGTASLLAIILNTAKEKGGCGFTGMVKAFGYGTPPVVNDAEADSKFLESTKQYIIAVVNQHDLVSRIATQNMASYVWMVNNASIMEEWTGKKKAKPVEETEDKPKGMFGSAMGSAKAMGSAMGNKLAEGASDLGVKAIAKMQELIDKALEHISGNKADQEFKVLWVPGRVQHISYKYKGQVNDAKNFAVRKASRGQGPTKMRLKCGVEVDPRENIMMHEVPKNLPRLCWIILDVRMGLDHLMGNYLRNLAEVYYNCPEPKKKSTSQRSAQSADEKSAFAGCVDKVRTACIIS